MILQILNIDWSEYKKFTRFQNDDFSFQNILWSWQTWLTLDIKYDKFDLIWKFAKFFVDDSLIYSGFVLDEKYDFNDKTTLTIEWVFWILNRITTTRDYSNHQATINYLYTLLTARYSVFDFSKDITDVDNYTPSTSTSYRTWSNIVKTIVKDSQYDFYFWADTKLIFKKQMSTKTHILKLWPDGDISWWFIWQNMSNYVSYAWIIDTWVTWTDTNFYIENEEDTAKFWRSSRQIWSTNWTYSWTKPARDARKMLQSPEKKTQIKVKKDIFKYQVWDYITIINSPVKIENVKIVSIVFTRYYATLKLDGFSNIYTNLTSI